jgi:hypothetical protein
VSTATTAVGIGLTVAIFIGALALAAGSAPRSSPPARRQRDRAAEGRRQRDLERRHARAGEHPAGEPAVAVGPDGRPLASAEMVIVVNKDAARAEGLVQRRCCAASDAAAGSLRGGITIVAGACSRPAPTRSSSPAHRRPVRALHVGDKLRFEQRDFTVVGQFPAKGSAFESEIWGDAAVLDAGAPPRGHFQTSCSA